MFTWQFVSILNGLDVIRHVAGISLLGRNCGGFGQMTPNTSNERKTLARSALPYAKLRLLSHCAWIYLYLACAGAQEKKAGRKKSQLEVFISRMRGANPSGRIPTKLGICVRLTDIIKRAKFHRYNLRGFGAVRCWNFHVAIGNRGRP